jgi:hypothetical protein
LYFPQRSVRDRRYKLIASLLQDRPNPTAHCYSSDTRWKIGAATAELASASAVVRRAYDTWHNAPAEELYDLEKDPHEFNNLAGKPEYAAIQKRLRAELKAWQQRTNDPLADPAALAALTQEHDSITKAYYQAERRGGSKAFRWKYHQYMRRH